MNKFVVLSTQRSGSVALIQSLSSHPDVVCFGEIFLKGATYERKMSVPAGRANFLYEEFARESLSRRVWCRLASGACERAFLVEFYRRQSDVSAAGFKLMYSQVGHHPGALDWILGNDVRIVHLVREDALRVILSRLTRAQTGVAHSASQIGPAVLRVDPKRLIRELDVRERVLSRFRTLLAGRPNAIEIRYEDYIERRESENQRILDFLGVSPDTELSSGVIRQKRYPLRQIIENYDEVVAALQPTPHIKFFSDDPGMPQANA